MDLLNIVTYVVWMEFGQSQYGVHFMELLQVSLNTILFNFNFKTPVYSVVQKL